MHLPSWRADLFWAYNRDAPNYSFKGNQNRSDFAPLNSGVRPMKRYAIAALLLLSASCAHRYDGVIASFDAERTNVDPSRYDIPRVSWGAHGGLWVTTVTLVRRSDWVAKQSIRVRKDSTTVTVCYSKTPWPGKPFDATLAPVHLIFVVGGVERGDKRTVLLSSKCGRAT
jgi:hypothetical protein